MRICAISDSACRQASAIRPSRVAVCERPDRWSKQSAASLAFGYEICGHAAAARDGIRGDRERRRADGAACWSARHARDGMAACFTDIHAASPASGRPAEVATTGPLAAAAGRGGGNGQGGVAGCVESGGRRAPREICGRRSLHPRRVHCDLRGFFPAESPQIVFLVKLDRPHGTYYGGSTAAPVTKATLQAALAARGTPLDRSAVAVSGLIDPVARCDTHEVHQPHVESALLVRDRTPRRRARGARSRGGRHRARRRQRRGDGRGRDAADPRCVAARCGARSSRVGIPRSCRRARPRRIHGTVRRSFARRGGMVVVQAGRGR